MEGTVIHRGFLSPPGNLKMTGGIALALSQPPSSTCKRHSRQVVTLADEGTLGHPRKLFRVYNNATSAPQDKEGSISRIGIGSFPTSSSVAHIQSSCRICGICTLLGREILERFTYLRVGISQRELDASDQIISIVCR